MLCKEEVEIDGPRDRPLGSACLLLACLPISPGLQCWEDCLSTVGFRETRDTASGVLWFGAVSTTHYQSFNLGG